VPPGDLGLAIYPASDMAILINTFPINVSLFKVVVASYAVARVS